MFENEINQNNNRASFIGIRLIKDSIFRTMKLHDIIKRKFCLLLIFIILMQLLSCSIDNYKFLAKIERKKYPYLVLDSSNFKSNAVLETGVRKIIKIDDKYNSNYVSYIFLPPGNHTIVAENYNSASIVDSRQGDYSGGRYSETIYSHTSTWSFIDTVSYSFKEGRRYFFNNPDQILDSQKYVRNHTLIDLALYGALGGMIVFLMSIL